MRKTLIAGNWKMNLTVTEAESFFKSFKIQKKEGVELLFCPPFTDIPITRFFLERSSILWGAQNVYPEDKGAFTGEISAPMLKDLGCSYVICGHSERRQILGESDELVARKVKAVLSHDMIPILCVGETRKERKARQKKESEVKSEPPSSNFPKKRQPKWSLPMNRSGPSDPERQLRRKTLRKSQPSSVRP